MVARLIERRARELAAGWAQGHVRQTSRPCRRGAWPGTTYATYTIRVRDVISTRSTTDRRLLRTVVASRTDEALLLLGSACQERVVEQRQHAARVRHRAV